VARRIILAMRRNPMASHSQSSPHHAAGHPLEAQLLERIASALRDAGWKIQSQHRDLKADLVVADSARRYAVELKVVREPRKAELQAALAAAILQSKAIAKSIGARPLAIVGAPHISEAMAVALRQYAQEYGEGSAFGFVDSRGRLELHGAGLRDVSSSVGVPPASSSSRPRAASRVDVFSDLGQWLLKVLLAKQLPENLLHAPRAVFRNAKHLAEVAGVSVAQAARQVAQLRADGFLEDSPSLRLVRVRDLLEDWCAANRRLPLDFSARWLFPPKDPRKHVKDVLRKWSASRLERSLLPDSAMWARGAARASLGLFGACEAMGFGFVAGAPLHVYVEDVSNRAFEELGLMPAGAGERVDLFLRQPKHPESIFRGAVWQDGVAVSDVIQCWLDVGDHPARGQEQAQQLWNRVLKPKLVEA
jgi:hypothetical protein